MRAEEACSLAPGDVTTDTNGTTWVHVRKGKTAAAKRRVPVVAPQVVSMLTARAASVAAVEAGAVFYELPLDRYGQRSRAMEQRLRLRLRRVMGNTDPTLTAQHGWRHRARTCLEQAAIAPSVADWIMGHARPGIGLSTYSKPSDQQLIEAARAIPLPAAP